MGNDAEKHVGPYDNDVCHFCGNSDRKSPTESAKHVAGYRRAEDSRPSGPFFDACEACAKVPYPQPKQFKENDNAE